jgi:hypothetical protein
MPTASTAEMAAASIVASAAAMIAAPLRQNWPGTHKRKQSSPRQSRQAIFFQHRPSSPDDWMRDRAGTLSTIQNVKNK